MEIKNVWGRSDWFQATFQKGMKIYIANGKTMSDVIMDIYKQVLMDQKHA